MRRGSVRTVGERFWKRRWSSRRFKIRCRMPLNVLDLIPTRRVVVIDAATDKPEELLDKSWDSKIVEIKKERVTFGRVQIYADVSLPGRLVAKTLFEIHWNEERCWHEVELYPCVYPPSLNGRPLIPGESNPLFVGDVLT